MRLTRLGRQQRKLKQQQQQKYISNRTARAASARLCFMHDMNIRPLVCQATLEGIVSLDAMTIAI